VHIVDVCEFAVDNVCPFSLSLFWIFFIDLVGEAPPNMPESVTFRYFLPASNAVVNSDIAFGRSLGE